MTSCPTALTAQREEPALRKTSRAGNADGFTLLELVCVLAIVSILAAIVIPALPYGTSRARLESFAIETAAMLKADRNAAIRNRVQIVTEVDAPSRLVRSGATGRVIRVPDDVVFDATLAARCNQRPAGQTRINKLLERGFHKPGDVENRLGYHVGQLGG